MKSRQITVALIILIIVEIKGQDQKGTESSCGKRLVDHGALIPNGFLSNEGDWPWHAAIFHLNQYLTYKCGGTLLNPWVILTAAHCVYKYNQPMAPGRVSVQLGKYNLKVFSTNTQQVEVFNIIPHSNFNASNLNNDIAILRLATQATLNNYVQPICLPNKLDIQEITGKLGTVVGWGVTEADEVSPILRQVFMPVVSNITCLQSNQPLFGASLTENNFCAGFRNETSVCDGDSGGSISFAESGVYYIRGIFLLAKSRTDMQLCSTKEYVIFTDVARYLPWIENVLVFRLAASAEVFWRQVKLYINDVDKVAYAEISNGDITDEIWIDRSFDGGNNFESRLGHAVIPSGYKSVRTSYFTLESGGREGLLRAVGKPGNRAEKAFTSWEGAH